MKALWRLRRKKGKMYGHQDNSDNGSSSQVPPWLVRAEVTIRHGDSVTSETVQMPPGTTTTTDAGGIRMICRWNTSEPNSTSTSTSATTSNAFLSSDSIAGGFGFQRGNILFTSTPPERPSQKSGGSYTLPRTSSSGNDDSISSRNRANVSDSGYNSEQFSPHTYSSLPVRRSQQYNRPCKSTCSIVLSTTGADKPNPEKAMSAESSKITPSVDQWHRRPSHQYVFSRHQFSTVPEVCEDCAEGSTSSAFTTHFCTRVAEKTAINNRVTTVSKDAASQTTDVESVRSSSTVKSSRIRGKSGTGANQRSEQKKKQEIRSPPASVGNTSTGPPVDPEKSDSSTKEDSSKRKSRTVHIDVYCTGSDDNASTDTISEDERSTPMTVFENEDVKVTHTQATDDLPRGFQDTNAFLKRSAERRCASFRNAPMRMPSLASSKGYDSDDVLSSLYPSRFSSYSGIRDLDSVPCSAVSSSTALSPYDYDSTVTSSKDTFSDIESLINSKSGLTPCDSFEYANTADRDRIRKMDILAKASNERNKTWRSPQIERKHLLQDRKMREYFEKHEINWSSGESAEDSDESGAVGWSFISGEDKSRFVKRDSNVRCTSKNQIEELNATNLGLEHRNTQEECSQFATHRDYVPYTNVLRDHIGPFGSKSPSPLPSTMPSRVTSPFTTPYGERTDHIIKASKFGAVINAFRKPGHHIGPSKNPTCLCEHCRRYFEDGARERSSSLSELERHPTFKSPKE